MNTRRCRRPQADAPAERAPTRGYPGAFAVAALLMLEPGAARAAGAPSLEGFTGQLTTPSAWVQESGTADLVFTNSPRTDPSTTRTYVVNIGMLRYLELAGRVTDVSSPPGPRDLSFNAKLQLPLDLLAPGLPIALAVGTQDEGGAATHFATRYAVASARLWRASASIGWGTGPYRMEGIFGGGSLSPLDGLDLLAEWDTAHVNAGVRVSVPLARLGLPLRLGGIAMSALDREPRRIQWGATLEVPLWLNARPEGRTPAPQPKGAAAPPPREGAPSLPVTAVPATEASMALTSWTPAGGDAAGPEAPALLDLEASLVEAGFEEVRVGRDGELLVVEYENSVFNHAEADGVQAVRREIAKAGLAGGPTALVLKQNGLRVAELVEAGASRDAEASWTYAPTAHRAVWASAAPRNRRALHGALVIAPGLRTFVATEVGVLDYVVSLRPDAIVPLWPGATAFARADVPLTWSDDLRDGGRLEPFRDGPRLEYAMLHQAVPLARGLWAMIGGGVFRTIDAGGVGELLWSPGEGELALGVQGSWTADEHGTERRGATASARFRIAPLELVAAVRAGQFVNGDRGATAQLARWFGDTQVGLYYTRTDVAIAGAFVSVPLTPRRDMRPGWLQVRGRRFGHDLGSVVGDDRNPLRPGLGVPPMTPWNLEAAYLDEGRLGSAGLTRAVSGASVARQ